MTEGKKLPQITQGTLLLKLARRQQFLKILEKHNLLSGYSLPANHNDAKQTCAKKAAKKRNQ